MRKKSVLLLCFFAVGSILNAQSKKDLDRQAILKMCGCYDITFKYTETFAPEIDYEKKLDYTAVALELALPILDEANKISIQHLLVVNDTTVVKHWRQDWVYENQEVFYYDRDNNWKFTKLSADAVTGQWTQKVYQVDDSPRYSGSATWVHFDGKSYWENTTSSPLPRREHTKRSDYNVMLRGNRQEITDYGWVHEQDNDKVIRESDREDVLLVQEKGWNIYTKVDQEKCQLAADWWAKHGGFWANARAAWDEVYNREGNLTLAKSVDERPLFMHLYPLEKMGAGKEQIAAAIAKFVNTSKVVTSEAGE